MIHSVIDDLDSDLETVQQDPLECTSAFYFMLAKKRRQYNRNKDVPDRGMEAGRERRFAEEHRG